MRQIVAAIDSTTVRGARDTALVLLGLAGALRRSKLAALTLADLEPKPRRFRPAAALALGDDLDGLVTYDERLADAAQLNGLVVTAPASS